MIGIDVSEDQLAHAIRKDNIEYRCNRGEDLSFLPSNSVDLVTIATALHWLDFDEFIVNVNRILKPQTGVLAIWTYSFGTLDNAEADAINREFSRVNFASYFSERQLLVENFYESLLPRFPYQSTLRQYTIEREVKTTLGGLIGFIQTTSSSEAFRREHSEEIYREILDDLRKKLVHCYRPTESDQTNDTDSIPVTISSPIRLYLMRKNEA